MKSEEVRGKRKMQIYVDGNAVRSGNGQKEYPFQTISEAAKIAMPGDEVLVAPGDRKGTRLNSSHPLSSRMPSSA